MSRESVYALIAITIGFLLILFVASAHADQPECTGDRHYDGVACCLVMDPPSTTTTTLPRERGLCSDGTTPCTCPGTCDDGQACACSIPQQPATCPTVMCVCDSAGGAMTGVVNVTVNKCPDVVFPNYIPCKRKHGKIVCPKPNYHGRVISPLPLS